MRLPIALLVMTVTGSFFYILLLDAGVTGGIATASGAIVGIFGFFENQLTQDVKPYWAELIRAIGNWHTEIFAYFDYPITNAYTEAMNSVIRHVDRMGRSYSFETIRAKMLYTKSIHKTQRPKMNKRYDLGTPAFCRKGTVMERALPPQIIEENKVINYGVDMEKLAKEIQKGTLRFED